MDTSGHATSLNRIGSLPPLPRNYSVQTIVAHFGIPKSTLYRWVSEGHFPRPRPLGPPGTRRVGFVEAEVLKWYADPANYRAEAA